VIVVASVGAEVASDAGPDGKVDACSAVVATGVEGGVDVQASTAHVDTATRPKRLKLPLDGMATLWHLRPPWINRWIPYESAG